MKIIITGGGTAGHVNPAAAIAEEITRRSPNSEILFIGREGGKENRAIERLGLKCEFLKVRGFRRKLFGGNIKALTLALSAMKKSETLIKDFSPDAVIGTGGYVCWPVLRAAKKLKIPTLIHESNAVPGLVTKILARDCDKVLLGYKKAADKLPRSAKISIVGNPVRKDFRVISRQKARSALGIEPEEIFVVSFGGSGGAEKLNRAVIDVMKNYSVKEKTIKHLHGVGERFFKSQNEPSLKKGIFGCRIVPYIEDMATVLCAADIAITRSGALTLAELSFAGTPTILIPSPNVTANHQYENAKAFFEGGAAVLIEESERLYEDIQRELCALVNDRAKRMTLSKNIKSLALTDSAERIYRQIESLI